MYRSYFFLNKYVLELNELLKSAKCIDAYSQEKDKLVMHFKLISGEDIFVDFSVNPGLPYFIIKENLHRAKINTIDFFPNYFPSQLLTIKIADNDRIVKLEFESFNIYFSIRGKFTNLILIDRNENVIFFKDPPDDISKSFYNEITNTIFIDHFNRLHLRDNFPGTGIEDIRKLLPIIGKEIVNEAKARLNKVTEDSLVSEVEKFISEIDKSRPCIFINEKSKELSLGTKDTILFSYTKKIVFEKYSEAYNYFIGKFFYYSSIVSREKIIAKHLQKELEKTGNKLNNLKARIDNGSKEELYNKIGNLLLINIRKIHAGMKSITIEDIYEENKPVQIKLNEAVSPKQNVDQYFNKAKSDRINLEKSKVLYEKAKKDFHKLKEIESIFNTANTPEDYKKIIEQLKIKSQTKINQKENMDIKFKHYIIENKYDLFVGKDSQNNDLLTVKFAKQNDYWFHARSVPGSHVVLRVENTKEAVPKNILKKAAALAAFHSKAKTAGMVPVSYTLKKYVVKKKGMAPGKVALLKEDVLIVRPEIPADCEFITND